MNTRASSPTERKTSLGWMEERNKWRNQIDRLEAALRATEDPADKEAFANALANPALRFPPVATAASGEPQAETPEPMSAEHDVRTILLKVVPGDGEGLEVYAKSVKDIEDLLARMGEELEEWQLGMRKLSASPEPTMADAIAAGDGTLHGAIDHWQNRALAAEAALAGTEAAPTVEKSDREWWEFCRPFVYMNGSHEMPNYAAICRAVVTLAQPAQAGKPLTGTQIIALRAAVPDGEWASRDEAEFFERGVKAAEKHHGIGNATGGTAP